MKKMVLVVLIAGLCCLAGCGPEEESQMQSMEQIYNEAGVPVRVETVNEQSFAATLNYSATLQATSEATAYAKLADVVQEIKFQVGDYVAKDETVIVFPRNNQSAQYYQAKAGYDLAHQTHQRMERLYNEGLVSKQELDQAAANFKVAQANLNSVDDAIQVKAPLSGYLTQLNVKVTDNVGVGTPLFTISNLDEIEARVWASSKEIDQIKLGQSVVMEWNGQQYQGSVSQVSRIMNAGRKAFEVRTVFKNPTKELTSGITAGISIETYRNDGVIAVPRKCLINGGDKYFVYLVKEGKAVRREVTLGREQGVTVELLSGVEPGDQLIVEGGNMVSDSVLVNLVNDKRV